MLGQGNFSKVYLAKSRMDGWEYAIKRSKHEVAEEALKRQWFQVCFWKQRPALRSAEVLRQIN